MNSEYDLTNEEELNYLNGRLLKGDGWVSYQSYDTDSFSKAASFVSIENSVASSIGGRLAKLIYRGMSLFDSKELCEAQAKTAADLIKEGKNSGAKKMKITIEQEAGLHFEAPIKEGINIRTMAGNKGKMTIEVEYS